jgi:uncharacterized damage-inducible protein DinB
VLLHSNSEENDVEDLSYPIGKFQAPPRFDDDLRRQFIDQIAEAPAKLRAAVRGLSDEQLDTPYRSGGWTVRQVVHHLPDSHLNSYVRFKLAMTEQEPTIKPYEQQLWAELADSRTAPIEMSLDLLDALHKRWVLLLKSLKASGFSRTFRHPEMGIMTLDRTLALYAWHSLHHVAHITLLRQRMGWGYK